MSLFNHEISNYEDLFSSYPKFLTDIYEFDEILKVEGVILRELQNAVDLVIDNHFIDTMDDYCLSKLEEYLHLPISSSSSTLSERRALIKSLMLGKGRISMSQLVTILSAMTEGHVSGEIKDYDSLKNQYLSIYITDCTIKDRLKKVIKFVEERIPAHLMVNIYYRPEKIPVQKHLAVGSVTNMNQVCSSMGMRYNKNYNNIPIKVACRSTMTNGIAIIYNVLYGGKLNTNIENTINGGTFSYVHTNEINGGTLS